MKFRACKLIKFACFHTSTSVRHYNFWKFRTLLCKSIKFPCFVVFYAYLLFDELIEKLLTSFFYWLNSYQFYEKFAFFSTFTMIVIFLVNHTSTWSWNAVPYMTQLRSFISNYNKATSTRSGKTISYLELSYVQCFGSNENDNKQNDDDALARTNSVVFTGC